MRKRIQRGFSSFAVTAALSVAILILAVAYILMPRKPQTLSQQVPETQSEQSIDPDMIVLDPRATTTSSKSGLSPLGDAVWGRVISAFSSASPDGLPLQDPTTTAAEIAKSLKPIVQARTYGASELKTTPDTSLNRILQYRNELRDALAPLLSITEPEYVTFARYIQTHDQLNLTILEHDADLYRVSASSTLKVVVPQDAVSYHLGILNAMEGFAAKLEALSSHSGDPFASAALLRSYNEGEQDMLMSFNSLAQYYRSKAGAAGTATTTTHS